MTLTFINYKFSYIYSSIEMFIFDYKFLKPWNLCYITRIRSIFLSLGSDSNNFFFSLIPQVQRFQQYISLSQKKKKMNKQNFPIFQNLSMNGHCIKMTKVSKSSQNLQNQRGNSQPSKKYTTFQSVPSKSIRKNLFHQELKQKMTNNQKLSIKIHNAPKKLKILSHINESHNKQKILTKNEKRDIQSLLKALIQIDLIQLLLQLNLANKSRTNSIIMKSSFFVQLLQKIALLTLDKKYTQSSQVFYLNDTLKSIRQKINMMKNQEKQHKINICKNLEVNNTNALYYGSKKAVQTQLDRLNAQKQNLKQEIKQLNSQMRSISSYTKQKNQQIINQNRQLCQLMRRIQDLKNDENHLIRQVSRFQDVFTNLDHQYNSLITYVNTQTKNKHLQLASIAYKNIQSQIYEYAVYLQANQLATSETYESIQLKNQCFIINNLEQYLKEINKDIVKNQEMSLDQKQDLMRNFVLNAQKQYKRKDEQYKKLLDFKTKCIRRFVNMMKKWLDNWTLKQQYLANLRKQFIVDNKVFLEKRNTFFQSQLCVQLHIVLEGQLQINYNSLPNNRGKLQVGQFFLLISFFMRIQISLIQGQI